MQTTRAELVQHRPAFALRRCNNEASGDAARHRSRAIPPPRAHKHMARGLRDATRARGYETNGVRLHLGKAVARNDRKRRCAVTEDSTQTQIEEASAAGAGLDDLKSTLGCGTVCGSCVPEIKRLLNTMAVA
jgi:NAD(P)H-nitrite reductase large subunit